MLGETYFLTCVVKGAGNLSPMITYHWMKARGTLWTQVGTDSKLFISRPTLRLSDAGVYTCSATVKSDYLMYDITKQNVSDVIFQSELASIALYL